jgi:DsbC/DsbD-like thiol-disulfide interchange protein
MTSRLARVVALTALTLDAASSEAASGPEFRTPEGSVRLVSAWATAPAGGDARLGVAFDLAPGWHVYWENPGDAGYPPELRIAEGSPLGGAELRYPAPTRYELPGELVAFGYAGRPIYPVDARLATVPGPTARLDATLDYLVCADSCVPYSAPLALELAVGEPREDPAVAPELAAWRERLPRAATELERVDAQLVAVEGPELELRLTLVGEGLRALEPDLFFAVHPLVALDRPRFAAAADGPGFAVRLRPLDETRPLPDRLQLAWTATGFERGGRPAAWHGTVDLERPGPLGGLGRRGLLAAALALATALALVARRALAHRSHRR